MTHSCFPGKFLEDEKTAAIYSFSHTSNVLLHKCLGNEWMKDERLCLKRKETSFLRKGEDYRFQKENISLHRFFLESYNFWSWKILLMVTAILSTYSISHSLNFYTFKFGDYFLKIGFPPSPSIWDFSSFRDEEPALCFYCLPSLAP